MMRIMRMKKSMSKNIENLKLLDKRKRQNEEEKLLKSPAEIIESKMEYKPIIGEDDLFITELGWMHTTDSWGNYVKLERRIRGGYYVSSFNSHQYKLCNIVYRYFIGPIPDKKVVVCIKGKNPKKDNLELKNHSHWAVKSLIGKVFKNGWKVKKENKGTHGTKSVLLSCPCGKKEVERTYNSKLESNTINCGCITLTATRKIDKKLAKKILQERESGKK